MSRGRSLAAGTLPSRAAACLLVGGALAWLAGGRVLEAIGVPTRRPAREIELVARDSRFNGVNPTIEVAPGERLRLVVKNDDPETWHDLVIGGLDGQRTTLLAPGESATLEFTAPASGILKYGCSVHPRFMDGRIVVARRRS